VLISHISEVTGQYTDVSTERIRQGCKYLLQPIIRFLLRNGVMWRDFGEWAKEVFVEVAREDYGLQGRPTNNARVAVLAGLSRREVARIREQINDTDGAAQPHSGNRISEILTGWHTDEDFLDADGQPRVLTEDGNEGSLTALLKRYAGDLPHISLRKEMLQRGLIESVADGSYRVLYREFIYPQLDPEIFLRMSSALHDHGATLEHNLDPERSKAPRFEGIAQNTNVSPQAAAAFAKLIESRGMDFLREADQWLAEHEAKDSSKVQRRNARLGIGVYLIHDEQKGEQG